MISKDDFKSVKLTPLSAYGLVALLVIILFWIIGVLGDAVNEKAENVANAQIELETLNQLKTTNIWESRLLESEYILADVTRGLWVGPTEGVIAAKLEQALRSNAQAVPVSNMRTNVEAVSTKIGTLDVLAFELSGSVTPPSSPLDMLTKIASEEQSIFVKDMSLNLDGRGRTASQFSISGYAPILVQETSSSSTAGE